MTTIWFNQPQYREAARRLWGDLLRGLAADFPGEDDQLAVLMQLDDLLDAEMDALNESYAEANGLTP